MDIQQLINEVVAKLRELYAALGEQRSKVGGAITALTGEPLEEGDAALRAAAQAATKKLEEIRTASDATAREP